MQLLRDDLESSCCNELVHFTLQFSISVLPQEKDTLLPRVFSAAKLLCQSCMLPGQSTVQRRHGCLHSILCVAPYQCVLLEIKC